MKNSESLQLTELDAREIREVDGGWLMLFAGSGIGLLLAAAYEIGKYDAQN